MMTYLVVLDKARRLPARIALQGRLVD